MRVASPSRCALAHVAAVLVDEHPAATSDRAAANCRYLLVVTFAQASASPSHGFHNEHARVVLLDRRTHATVWDGETPLGGGKSGLQAADVDEFVASVIAALHKDGIVDETAD